MNAHFKPAMTAEAADLSAPFERSSYQRSRGGDPVATIGALLVGLATIGAFAYMNPHFVKKEKREATIVTMMELPDDPPPAAETPPPPPDAPPPQPTISAPVPLVALAVAPVIAAPPPAPQAAPAPKAAPAPGPAVIAKGPENAGDLSAQVVFRKPIRVPMESRRQHEEGVVVLAVVLGIDGRVSSISIANSSGFPRLDRAALEAVEDWRWSPLVRDGQAVMVRGLVRIPFIRERGGPGGRGDRDGGRGGRDGHGRGHGDHDGPRGDRDFDRDGAGPDDRT